MQVKNIKDLLFVNEEETDLRAITRLCGDKPSDPSFVSGNTITGMPLSLA